MVGGGFNGGAWHKSDIVWHFITMGAVVMAVGIFADFTVQTQHPVDLVVVSATSCTHTSPPAPSRPPRARILRISRARF